jgi:solute carrier family 25 (mitochondrial S-adenosylmethionine transporter), member 26
MAAGLVTRLALHPFDTAKTRMQHLRGDMRAAAPAFARFVRAERVAGLYRGVAGALVGVLPYSAVYMPSYELAQRALGARLGTRTLLGARHVLAGAVAGLCGSVVKTPVDVVKKRVQAGLYRNVVAAAVAVAADARGKGLLPRVAAFYTGWRSAVLYDIPYNAIQFSILETVKRWQHRNSSTAPAASTTTRAVADTFAPRHRRDAATTTTKPGATAAAAPSSSPPGVPTAAKPRANILVGAATGALTSLVTEPLDVVKTRIMTQRIAAHVRPGVTYYRNWAHALATIAREEGVLALWKGSFPRLLWVSGSGALWYGTYATVRQYQQRRKNQLSP